MVYDYKIKILSYFLCLEFLLFSNLSIYLSIYIYIYNFIAFLFILLKRFSPKLCFCSWCHTHINIRIHTHIFWLCIISIGEFSLLAFVLIPNMIHFYLLFCFLCNYLWITHVYIFLAFRGKSLNFHDNALFKTILWFPVLQIIELK